MFLAGADGQTPELRAPSIKGAMRFWWRAVNGHLDLKTLKEKEAEIFGGGGEKASRSTFDLIVRIKEKKKIKGEDLPPNLEGLKYLGYIMYHQQKYREGYNIETTFDIIIRSKNDEVLEKAAAVIWLWIYFGGIGSRQRRGFGSISVLEVKSDINLKLNFNFKDDVENFYNYNLNKIKQLFDIKKIKNIPDYSTLHHAKFYVSKKSFASWDKVLNDIGKILKEIRVAPSDKKIKNRKFTLATLDQKAAFGLPIKVRNDKELNFKNTEKYGRMASPIYISVIKSSGGKYYWTVLRFTNKFMPDDTKLIFASKNGKIKNKWYYEEKMKKKGSFDAKRLIFYFDKENQRLVDDFFAEIYSKKKPQQSKAKKIILL
jgi:CRISPR-associated protein Cmr1